MGHQFGTAGQSFRKLLATFDAKSGFACGAVSVPPELTNVFLRYPFKCKQRGISHLNARIAFKDSRIVMAQLVGILAVLFCVFAAISATEIIVNVEQGPVAGTVFELAPNANMARFWVRPIIHKYDTNITR
jgi:hypothetical protein